MRYNTATFDQYCEERWEMPRRHADRLIAAAAFADLVSRDQLVSPSRESHIRPLLDRLETDDDRIAVWRDVLATTNARIKASDVAWPADQQGWLKTAAELTKTARRASTGA
jgi:hypothetical protein